MKVKYKVYVDHTYRSFIFEFDSIREAEYLTDTILGCLVHPELENIKISIIPEKIVEEKEENNE